MSKLIKLSDGTFTYAFECLGCKEMHGINDRWNWNGDYDRPTITPSIRVKGVKLTEKGEAEYEAWSKAGYSYTDKELDSIPTVCHSFVTDGKIQYLDDCTHELAGQTIELPNID